MVFELPLNPAGPGEEASNWIRGPVKTTGPRDVQERCRTLAVIIRSGG
jgi:hypothetical protein